jgi:anti-sigma factor ChrR (cupin superfamily)
VQVPAHSHRKEEQMIILEGELKVRGHRLRQGDVHVAHPETWHPVITVDRGCLILLRSECPLPAG